MAVVVRVKRRRNDCQPQSLEVSSKKLKLDDNPDTFKSIFKFAGTINSKNQQPIQIVKQAIGKEKLKREYLKYESNPVKLRTIHKQSALKSRYKIISQKCATKFDKLENDEPSEEVTEAKYRLIDLETTEDIAATFCDDEITCNGVAMSKFNKCGGREANVAYVYDLFYTNDKSLNYNALDDTLEFEAYREEELYMGYGENYEDDYDAMMMQYEEDDENHENNWRNDYPDEDPKYYDDDDDDDDEHEFDEYDNEYDDIADSVCLYET